MEIKRRELEQQSCVRERESRQTDEPHSKHKMTPGVTTIDAVGSAKFVTKLDLLKHYWQVPLTLPASEISAFVTPDNFVQHRVMPFGLRNAPTTFQHLTHNVLDGV